MGCQNGQHFCHASNSDICFENVHMWWHSTCKLYSFVVGIPHWMWWPNWKLFLCWAGVMPLQNQCWEKSQENSHKKVEKKVGRKVGNKPGKKMRIWENFFVSKYLVAYKGCSAKKEEFFVSISPPQYYFFVICSLLWYVACIQRCAYWLGIAVLSVQ